MRHRVFALLASVSLATGLLAAAPGLTLATTHCTSENVNFQYHDWMDDNYMTITLHAVGCYNGITSWATDVRATLSGSRWGLLGATVPRPDPSTETSPTTGNTWWEARPVFGASGGFDLLLTPTAMLSPSGVWYAYDYTAKACSSNLVSLFPMAYVPKPPEGSPDYPQIGTDDLFGGGGATGSCPSVTIFQPVFHQLWFSQWTP